MMETPVLDGKVLRERYLREEMLPTIFCSGCGHGVVLDYTFRAIDELGLQLDQMAFASGIGCSSRLPGYINADGLHTTHGRALAFATGVKGGNPDLEVVVFTGDGDCMGIGGNHFIHAARRNIDMTVILLNNYIYGMTGGQQAPTAPTGTRATTAPYGSVEQGFNVSEVARALGAAYVARWPVSRPAPVIQSIRDGIANPGFALVELMSPCPTAFGRRNKLGDIKTLWDYYDDLTILIEDYDKIMATGTPTEQKAIQDKVQIGVFADNPIEGFFSKYGKLVDKLVPPKPSQAGGTPL